MNKIFRVIWSAVNNTWIVVSELAKGKQKSAACTSTNYVTKLSLPKLSILSTALVVGGFISMPNVFAASISVSSFQELKNALSSLNNNEDNTIILTKDITLTSTLTTALGKNNNLTIDGNSHSLNVKGNALVFSGGDSDQYAANVNFTNFNTISSNNGTSNAIVRVYDKTSNVNITFDNIKTMPDGMIGLLSTSYSAGSNVQNPYSQLIIGNIDNPITIKTAAYKQLANASKITFDGKMSLTAQKSNTSWSYIFWSNSPINQNVITFNSDADVAMNLEKGNQFTSGDTSSSKGYSYIFKDGAKFLLWSQQNVFGDATGSNVGLKIGSYDKSTQTFGDGVTLKIAGVGGAQLTGNGLTNLGGVAGGIDNGSNGSDDVIFDLAQGSNFNVTGTGINVTKNTGNSSGIYIRSATDINAATGMQITHNGTGNVVVKNDGSITSTVAGMQLSSTSGNKMDIDLTDGTLNVNSGSGIIAGSDSASGNVNLNINNGTINLKGSGNGIDLSSSSAANIHAITGTTIKFANGATGQVIKTGVAKVILKDNHINVVDTTAFNDQGLNNITFANSDNNTNNIITVTGSGTGLSLDNDLSAVNNSFLTVNVTDSTGNEGTIGTGTAINIKGGSTSDIINITKQIKINALGATAINIGGTNARQFVNNGSVNGNVTFSNGSVNNTIVNNGVLDGNLTAGNGGNTLTLNKGSQSKGTIKLGNGNNTVNISDSTYVNNVVTGSGNDTFNLTNMNASSTNYIGTLNAGTGTNTLNLNTSSLALNSASFLKNFANINLTNSSLSLVNKSNIASGNININNQSTLTFDASYQDSFVSTLLGNGKVDISNKANVTLNSSNSFAGTWQIENGGILNTSASNQFGSGTVNVAGTLNLNQTSFNNALQGTGSVNVNASGNPFSFGTKANSGFAGTVNLANTQFNLFGNNTSTLKNATLGLSANSTTNVDSGNQAVGNVKLNGGTLVFNDTGIINTGTLSSSQNSIVKINTSTIPNTDFDSTVNLLDQNSGQSEQLIIAKDSSALKLSALTLKDEKGNALGNGVIGNIIQNKTTVAKGSYNYQLVNNNGLSVDYALTALDLQKNQTLSLNTTNASNRDLTAQLLGSGNLILATDETGLRIANSNNSYTGATTVTAGTVNAGSNNAFGQTNQLAVNQAATVDLATYNQTVGSLNNQGHIALTKGSLTVNNAATNSGVINIAEGSLVLNNGGSSTTTNGITGSGTLTVAGGNLAISAANNLSGNTKINTSASISLNKTGSLGSSNVTVSGNLNLNDSTTLVNKLSGTGNVNTNATVTLTGNNAGFNGQQVIGENSNLIIANAQSLGSTSAKIKLSDTSSTLTLSGVATAIANAISGSAGTVNLTKSANVNLTGNNSGFAGNYVLTNNSTLKAGQSNNLATSGVTIDSGSTLIFNNFNAGIATELANRLSGAGHFNLSGSNLSLTGNNANMANFTGNINIANQSNLTVSQSGQLNDNSALSIASINDKLTINSQGDFNLNNVLTGKGNVTVGTAGNQFNFGANANSGFAGTVNLNNTQFDLTGNNTNALTAANLNLLTGSTTTVGSGEQTVGDVTLSGGSIAFNGTGTINTNTLSTTQNSIVEIDTSAIPNTDLDSNANLLDQNAGQSKQLITAKDSSSLKLADLTLTDESGNLLGEDVVDNIIQNNVTVAKGSYDYQLVNDNGLGVDYALTALDLQNGKTLILDSTGAENRTLTAQLTGSGNLSLSTDKTGLTLNNSRNSYTGATTITAGMVNAGSENAFGQTSQLTVDKSATVDLSTHNQTVGSLNNQGNIALTQGNLTVSQSATNSGVINLAGGSLVLNQGGSSTTTNGLTGSGTLTVAGGDLEIAALNNLSGNTQIKAGASVSLTNEASLGSSVVAVAGDLNLNSNTALANQLKGTGNINTHASVSLTGDNSSFTGSQVIGKDAVLTVSRTNNLGASNATVSLTDKTANLNLTGLSGDVANTLVGESGTVNVTANSSTSLTGNNSQFSGNYVINDESTLTASNSNNLGTSTITIDTDSALVFNHLNAGSATELTNNLSGTGAVNLSSSNLILTGNNANMANFTGQINIANQSNLTVSQNGQLNDGATLAIANTDDKLIIHSDADFNLNNKLTGLGNITVDTAGNQFSFGANANNGFEGTVNLNDTQFELTGNNTNALTAANLNLSTGSTTTVGSGVQVVGDVTLNGGTIVFDGQGSITTDKLITTQGSIIQINTDNIPNTDLDSTANLLDQNSGKSEQLITANDSTNMAIKDLTLQDQQGNELQHGSIENITQNSHVVAKGSYDYQLVNNHGLSVDYALTALNLQKDQTLVLDSTGAQNRSLTAQLIGSGNLSLSTDKTGLTLNNSRNSYTGATTITAGMVNAGSENAFGQTSQLTVDKSATVDLSTHNQTIGSLNNQGNIALTQGNLTVSQSATNSGVINLAGGSLVLNQGGSSTTTNGLTGSGTLTVAGGDLAISAANNLSGNTQINTGASVSLTDEGSLGSSVVVVAGDLNLNSDTVLVNQLTGTGDINTHASVGLTSDNSSFTGTQVIGQNGNLIVSNANNLGADNATVNLTDKTAQLTLSGLSGSVANMLVGQAGTVNITTGSTVNLTGDNSDYTGDYVITGDSDLTVNNSNNLSTSDVAITAGSHLELVNFNADTATELTNNLSGAGNINLSASHLILTGNNTNIADFTGKIAITNKSNLTVSQNGQLNNSASITIATSGDSLNINSEGDFSLNNTLTGQGNVTVNTANHQFNFGTNANSGFAGTIDLNDTQFVLSGANTNALTDANLNLSTGSVTTVGAGDQVVGDVTLNGGTLVFNGDSTIDTGILTVSDNSIVQVNTNEIPATDVSDSANLLDQSAGVGKQLITATNNNNIDVNKLTLQDLAGNALTSSSQHDVIDNGNLVAQATYNYTLSKKEGLSVDYALTELDLQQDQTLTINSAGSSNQDLTAKLTGKGNLTLTADTDKAITLDNSANNYAGTTMVTAGVVSAGSDNAFGQTSQLTVNKNATIDLSTHNQTVGGLNNQGNIALTKGSLTVNNAATNNGVINLAGGSLVLNQGGSSTTTNGLIGSGTLTVAGGDLAISAANNLTGNTKINTGATISLSKTGSLGSSAVAVAGNLNLNATTTLVNKLSGTGHVNTHADITLTGDNSGFTGTQVIGQQGNLNISQANSLGANSAIVNLTDKTAKLTLSGLSGSVANALVGQAGTVNVTTGSTVNLTGDNTGYSGDYVITGNSDLTVSDSHNLAKSDVSIAAGSHLDLVNFNKGSATELVNNLTGAGSVNLSGSDLTLTENNANVASFTGNIDIENGSSLAVSNDNQLNDKTSINVATNSDRLNINSEGDFVLNNALTGQGNVTVNTSDHQFNFGANANSGFTGTVNLNNTQFNLTGNNTNALTAANLNLSTGSITTVGSGLQTVGDMTLNGGTIVFNGYGTIETGHLMVDNDSIVEINTQNIPSNSLSNSANILDQNAGMSNQLINASNSHNLDLTKLELQDTDGNSLDVGVVENLTQNGNVVAKGTYEYQLANQDGLAVKYALTGLDLQQDQTLNLDATGATNRTLTTHLMGNGNVMLTSDEKGLILNNSQNDYTGITTVTAGIVTAGSSNAFGDTSQLAINTGANVDFSGHNQIVGELANQGDIALNGGILTVNNLTTNSGHINLSAGSLVLNNGGTSSVVDGLTGAGHLTVAGGDLAINTANNGLTANTNIDAGASVTLTATGNLGQSAIDVLGDLNLNSDSSLTNVISGTGHVNTHADITLTGDNSAFTGTQVIGQNGDLTVSQSNNLGADNAIVNLTDKTANLTLSGLSGSVANTLVGEAGTVNMNTGSTVNLTGDNTGYSGGYVITGNSNLMVSDSHNLARSDVSIAAGSHLDLVNFNKGSATELVNNLTGAGSVNLSGSHLTLTENNANVAGFTGNIDIENGSSLAISNDSQLNDHASINVATSSDSFNINSKGDFALNNALTGQGNIKVDTAGNQFSFGDNANSSFAGTVNLNDTQFELMGTNTHVLAEANLTLSTGSQTTVGSGTQAVGDVTLNGGTLVFNGDSTIDTDKLTVTDNSIVKVNTDEIPTTDINDSANLLDQNAGVGKQLINAVNSDNVDVSKLTLQDLAGNALTSSDQHDIIDKGNIVAQATYDYTLSKKEGLSVDYALTELDLQQGQTLAINSAGSSNQDLTAKLTGSGNLTLTADTNKAITLDNSNNDYSGVTNVTAGTVNTDSDNAFGHSSELVTDIAATVNLAGHSQTVGGLINAGKIDLTGGNLTINDTASNSGQIDLAAGSLTLNHGGTSSSANGLSGNGQLNITQGDLAISAANNGLTADTTISSDASITLADTGNLGSSHVDIAGSLNLNGANDFANVLSGAGNINTHAAVTLSGDNSNFTGKQVIGENGELTVNNANNLGANSATVELIDASSSLTLSGVSGNIANVISGNAGNVNVTNDAVVNLTGDNTGFKGSYTITGNSSLTATNSNNLAESGIMINSGSALTFNQLNNTQSTELNNNLTGTGSVNLSNSTITLSKDNNKAVDFSGTINLTDAANLTVNNDNQLNKQASINLSGVNDVLNIASNSDYNFANSLSGKGQVIVNTDNNNFDFSQNVGGDFAGTVQLDKTNFELQGNNTQALENANLTLTTGSHTSVGDGEQTVGNLVIDGGELNFNNISENNGVFTSEGTINTGSLDISGSGTVNVALPQDVHPNIQGNTVTQLDAGEQILHLIHADNVIGYGDNIELQGKDGQALPQDVEENLINTGSIAKSATGYFNYKLATGEDHDGLYVNYGLVKLDLLGSAKNALILESKADQNNTANNLLTAEVTGVGDLAIVGDSSDAAITIVNSNNSYTGKTIVRSGALIVGEDHALGNTSALEIAAQASTNLNGKTQTIGNLANEGQLDLAGGSLIITNGGHSSADEGLSGGGELTLVGGEFVFDGTNTRLTSTNKIEQSATVNLINLAALGLGSTDVNGTLNLNNKGAFVNQLSGAGQINVAGDVALTADNSQFDGAFTINADKSLTVTDLNQLGTATINDNGNMVFNLNEEDQTLTNQLGGMGNLIKSGSGALTITGNLTYTGATSIKSGDLLVEDGAILGGTNAGIVTIASGSSLSGAGTVNGQVDNYGSVNVMTKIVKEENNENLLRSASVENNADIDTPIESTTSLTINNSFNNYAKVNIGTSENTVGNSLTINGDYNGNDGAIINMNTALGDNETSKLDQLVITGHAGGSTLIHINDVGGTGAMTNQQGVKLIDNGSSDVDAFKLDNVVVKGAYEYVLQRDNQDQDWYLTSYQDVRPDFGNYIANMEGATKSLLPSYGAKASGALAGGAGGMRSLDRIAKGDDQLSSVWMINSAGRSNGEAANGQISYNYNAFTSALGIDRTFYDNESLFVLGVMTGTTYVSSSSHNHNTGSDSSGSVNGTTFGIYGSWFLYGDNPLSPFVDYYLSYGSYHNKATSQGNQTDKYDSNLFSYTLQGGYPILMNDNWVVEPQAQASYLHYNIGNHTDHSGTDISQSLNGNWIFRTGAYFYPLEGNIKPYVGVNLWYDSTRSAVKFDETSISSDKAGFMIEGKLGLQAKVKQNLTVSGEINYRHGQHSSQNYSANIGIKYQF